VKTAYTTALGGALLLICSGALAQSRYTCADSGGNTYQSSQPCVGREVVQRYTCTNNGRTYASSQPCPSSGPVFYGSVATTPSDEPRVSKLEQAPDTIKHLSPRCASLNDAIRTAPARGLKDDVISDLKREYREKCSDEESAAESKMSRERREAKQQRAEAEKAEQRNRERTAIQQQQCGESKRILFTKRARTDLTDGEKADLQRFEDNYRSRCS
jgi:hypothetical protein